MPALERDGGKDRWQVIPAAKPLGTGAGEASGGENAEDGGRVRLAAAKTLGTGAGEASGKTAGDGG